MRREAVLAAAVSLLGSQVATAQVDAVEWRVEDWGNGHWYAFLPLEGNNQTWAAAHANGLSRGAELAAIESEAEWTLIRDAMRGAGYQRAWTRARNFGLREFRWDRRTPVAFAAWGDSACVNGPYPNDPSDWDSAIMIVDCQYATPTGVLVWDDIPVLYSFPGTQALLEWSADCDQNGLVDYGEIVRGEKTDANANGVPDCCESPAGCCPGDIDGDGAVNGIDLAIVLARWGGPAKDYPKADADGNGAVDGADLALVLGAWGACE